MLAQNLVARLSSVFSQLVLAALLRPADFGVISLTYTVTSIAAALTSVGLDDVVLQRERALRLWLGPAFWISLGLGVAAGLLVVAVSPVAAAVYQAPELTGLLAILALAMPLGALGSVPAMVLRARMQFGALAVYGSLETVGQALMTVGLAWQGFGAYSFVLPTPVLALVRAAVLWRLAASKPDLRPQPGRWKYVIGNTTVTFVNRIVISLINQGDYMALGLLGSQASVGVYYFGFRLAAQPLWTLAGNFSNVLYPALVQMRSDPERQNRAVLNSSTLLSFCVMPVALIQSAVAEPLIGRFFDPRWAASIPVIQLLSIGLALDAISWIAGALLNARGEFRAGLRYAAVQLPVFFLLVTAGALLHQAIGVAWAVCAFYALTQPVYVFLVYRRIGMTAWQVALIYLQPTAYAAVAVDAGLLASRLPPLAGLPLLRAAVIGAVGLALYAALVRWRAPAVWGALRDRTAAAFRRRAPA
jgi:PST family polysaccharide transporter